MDRIFCFIHPFILNQEILVYQNGEYIKTIRCSFKDLKDTLYTVCKENNIYNVDIGGNKYYGKKLQKDFSTSKYENEKIIITLI